MTPAAARRPPPRGARAGGVCRALRVVRLVSAAAALARLARAAGARAPVGAGPGRVPPGSTTISVVVPARDESRRIGPLLDALAAAPGVSEVIVVDDESSDDTAALAAAAGATVVVGTPRPPGWAGKAWALQQGIEAASSEWVVTLDADARPAPALPSALVARAAADGTDLLTVAGRFDCPTRGARWLHPAMLTTLVYRYGPPGAAEAPSPGRTMANGQCMVFRRRPLAAAGGLGPVAGAVVEDVALARRLATCGWSVDFLDAAPLLTVRMYEDLGDTWRGWGRSIGLPGVEPRHRQLLDLVVVLVAQALPLPRLVARRCDLVDVVLLAARIGTLVGTRHAYPRRGPAYWLSPLADVPAAVALALSVARRRQTWRGRDYDTGVAAVAAVAAPASIIPAGAGHATSGGAEPPGSPAGALGAGRRPRP